MSLHLDLIVLVLVLLIERVEGEGEEHDGQWERGRKWEVLRGGGR
jgi:hypothetical protein